MAKQQFTFGGSGGGTSGRATAFCLGKPSSNPRTVFGSFQFRIAGNLFFMGVEVFLIMCNSTVHALLLVSCFLQSFNVVNFTNCNLTMYQEKGKKIKIQNEAK